MNGGRVNRRTKYLLKLRGYGLTWDEYQELVKSQDGRCAICGEPEKPGFGRNDRLFVDHDHATGAVRGLVCTNCNAALGMMRDDVGLLMAAADYLVDPPAAILKGDDS